MASPDTFELYEDDDSWQSCVWCPGRLEEWGEGGGDSPAVLER